MIGVLGLDYPLDWPEPEIQWGLAKGCWGKGFASEAVQAVKRMAAEHVPSCFRTWSLREQVRTLEVFGITEVGGPTLPWRRMRQGARYDFSWSIS